MDLNRTDVLERMYEESGVLRQSEKYDSDRQRAAEERLNRMANLAREENMDIPSFLLDACESGQSTEVNAQTAEMLDRPKIASN